MVFLCWVELGGSHDLCDNRGMLLLQHLFGFYCGQALFLAVIENGAAVLVSHVAELAVFGSWVNVVPEDVQELLIGHF